MLEFVLTVMSIAVFFAVPLWMQHEIHDLVELKWSEWFPKWHKTMPARFSVPFISWTTTVILVLLLVEGFSILMFGPV